MAVKLILCGGVVAGVLTLGGCGGGTGDAAGQGALDAPAKRACDDFAHGYSEDQTPGSRVKLARKVAALAAKSETDDVATTATVLGEGAESGPTPWKVAAGAFLRTCLDDGWKR
ncbi:hypothetical protein BTM25_51060 [Actinomadura rubteroloni]|uniref:Lipoprotein n=1 Tax=Actinomadura rubteroloni TaxID=1926885 RepID=A0A2P4UCY2_9ACTN|nr:hypothetical protein [Actinomadura rubteroloni]POM22900.1 hypothetical protein BTM25_51060 [Actinomadura rubteroloni]